MNKMTIVVVSILAMLLSVAICTSQDLLSRQSVLVGQSSVGLGFLAEGSKVGPYIGSNLTMKSVECPSIRRLIVYVNDKRKVDWDGTSAIPEIKVKLGDIITMKICCNNNHYACPASLSVLNLEGKLLSTKHIKENSVKCFAYPTDRDLRIKVQNKIEGTASIKMSIFADCQQGCGAVYELHLSM